MPRLTATSNWMFICGWAHRKFFVSRLESFWNLTRKSDTKMTFGIMIPARIILESKFREDSKKDSKFIPNWIPTYFQYWYHRLLEYFSCHFGQWFQKDSKILIPIIGILIPKLGSFQFHIKFVSDGDIMESFWNHFYDTRNGILIPVFLRTCVMISILGYFWNHDSSFCIKAVSVIDICQSWISLKSWFQNSYHSGVMIPIFEFAVVDQHMLYLLSLWYQSWNHYSTFCIILVSWYQFWNLQYLTEHLLSLWYQIWNLIGIMIPILASFWCHDTNFRIRSTWPNICYTFCPSDIKIGISLESWFQYWYHSGVMIQVLESPVLDRRYVIPSVPLISKLESHWNHYSNIGIILVSWYQFLNPQYLTEHMLHLLSLWYQNWNLIGIMIPILASFWCHDTSFGISSTWLKICYTFCPSDIKIGISLESWFQYWYHSGVMIPIFESAVLDRTLCYTFCPSDIKIVPLNLIGIMIPILVSFWCHDSKSRIIPVSRYQFWNPQYFDRTYVIPTVPLISKLESHWNHDSKSRIIPVSWYQFLNPQIWRPKIPSVPLIPNLGSNWNPLYLTTHISFTFRPFNSKIGISLESRSHICYQTAFKIPLFESYIIWLSHMVWFSIVI